MAAPGVMRGGTSIKVGDIYYQAYEWPTGSGRWIVYRFNDADQLIAAFGEDPGVFRKSQGWFEENVIAVSEAEEVIGSWGSWSARMDTIMAEGARDMGVTDPGLAGRIANNIEMQRIMAAALEGDWTQEQIRAEQRKTDFWKNELYPGIEAFYDRTIDPERAWKQYVDNVTPALKALGYEPGADGRFTSQIGEMLSSGIDDEIFVSQVPTFLQAQQNSEFAGVLNQWAERELGRSVEFNDWFDLLSGESMPELEGVAEKARLAYNQQQAGAGLTDSQVASLADRTQLSEPEMRTLFSEFNQSLLALGDTGLKRGGLTRDELLSAFAGVNPQSGRTIEEVKLQAAKLARENDLFDEEKIAFYVGFNPSGTPNRPGLMALAPETG